MTTPAPIAELQTTITQLETQLRECDEQDRAADEQLGSSYAALAAGDAVPSWYTERAALVAQRRHALTLAVKAATAELQKAQRREQLAEQARKVSRIHELIGEDDAIGIEVGDLLDRLCEALGRQAHSRRQLSGAVHALVGRGNYLSASGYVDLGLHDLLDASHIYRMASIQLSGVLGWWRYEEAPMQGGRPFVTQLQAANALLRSNFDDVVTYDEGDFEEPKPKSATPHGAATWAIGG